MCKFTSALSTRLIVVSLYLAISSTAQASNWLSLQGLEPDGSANSVRIWGFVQVQYQHDQSSPNSSGAFVPAKLIGPSLDSQSTFNVNRARLGARGVAMHLDRKINYFLLAEFGNNEITAPKSSGVKLTDASLTFNHLKHASVRAGLFKHPGAEEALQAIHVFDYINFSSVTNQLLLERYPNRSFTPNIGAQPIPSETDLKGFDRSVGAFRDVGVQVFNTFTLRNKWEASYAAMIGNGNGLNFNDNDDNKELYLYLATEKVFGGRGARRSGMKFFAWSQTGKRTADLTDDATHNPREYDRKRYGLGGKYLHKPWRFSAEYMKGDGMIFQGPHNPSWGIGPGAGNPAAPGNGAFAKANGWYVEGGYYVPNSKWGIDLRHDEYTRLDGSRFEVQFTKTTIGTQFYFNPRVRIGFNYEISEGNATTFPAGAGPNANLDGIDNRFSVQITGIFSQ